MTQSKGGGASVPLGTVTFNVTTRQIGTARLGAALGLALAQLLSTAAAGAGGGVEVTPGWRETHGRALEWEAGLTHPVPGEPGREFLAV